MSSKKDRKDRDELEQAGTADVENAQLARILDRVLAVQRPAVLANIRALRGVAGRTRLPSS